MKKKKYITLAITLFLSNLQPTSAACTQEEINSFKRIEDNYTVKYEIDKSTQKYSLYFNRSKQNLYDFTVYTDSNFECEDISDTLTKCYPFESGEYQLTIDGQTETCNDILKTMTLKLPKYNKLSEDPLCEGIEEFVLCNPAYDKEIDYETFVSRVETYKKNHTSKPEETPKEEEPQNETLTKIVDYLKDHWIEITVITVFVILVTITIIITAKSIRKSRYLE